MDPRLLLITVLLLGLCAQAGAASAPRKCHISAGNLSVGYIGASPIGAHPVPGTYETPPPVDTLTRMKQAGLDAYEDYIAWGAVEREPGKWDWTQHDREYEAVKNAGLEYVAYNWIHFPPVWLRDGGDCTLMRCVEHRQNTNTLSIFDPRTLQYYDRFYKALHDHFGNRLDGVYACILGPYGEGNYPLDVSWLINCGHIHEGYWCADPYALAAFRDAMRANYVNIAALNGAWGTSLRSFSEILPPREIAGGVKPTPAAFASAQDRRRWLDFIIWYHQGIIDFAEGSIRTALKYWPREKVRLKPGGNAGGVNPVAWGTYCPGYAKVAAKYGIVLQPADCRGAVFGDKWVGTAYRFYGVPLSTEPAGDIDTNTFVRRLFSDASCGASQLFTYEFDRHVPELRKYAHLITGQPGETPVAVLCPTTLYRLGGDLGPTIRACEQLRDFTDFDVLDELLVRDGALTSHYRALVIFQNDYVDNAVQAKIDTWKQAGGSVIVGSDLLQVESTLKPFATDGVIDGLWITRRGRDALVYNGTDKAVKCDCRARGVAAEVAPHSIIDLPI